MDGLTKNRWLSIAFASTIFLSAFLLFLVQPLISKIILPWFGGSTGVWATCLVFFQSMLCLGYAYAHFLQRLPIQTQRWCHWGLLTLGLVCLPVMPAESWKPLDGNDPAFKIFFILLLKTGLPYLALSATGPLLQAWYARIFPEAKTYRLYALSNIASLSSLLLFPLWFERVLTSNGLSLVWSILFVCFVAFCGLIAYRVSKTNATIFLTASTKALETEGHAKSAVQSSPPPRHYLLWLALPAFASFLLLAGTNHLCQDIASTPFLWILPLCLYLLSFILCFDAPRWYVRRFYVVLGLIGLYGVIAMRELDDAELLSQGWLANGIIPFASPLLQALDWYTPSVLTNSTWASWLESQVQKATLNIDLIGQIFMHCLTLFSVFMVCHGELAQRKPSARFLTAFYLMISIGGAIGSILVSLVAPLIFPAIWEWLFGLTLSVVAFCGLLFRGRFRDDDRFAYRNRYICFVIPVLLVSGMVLWQNSRLPLQLASRLEAKLTPSETMPTDDQQFEEMFDAIASDQSYKTISATSGLLPSYYAIVGMLLLLILAGLGAFELRRQSAGRYLLKWTIVNLVAIIFVAFYLHDIFKFAPEELYKGNQANDQYFEKDSDVWRGRNFYGALTIKQTENLHFPDDSRRSLQHGRIVHGTQYIEGQNRSLPTTYYSEASGVGLAIEHVSHRLNVHVGAIGLGTGSLAAYAARNSSHAAMKADASNARREFELTIYEINPLVVSLSQGEDPWFTYLSDATQRGAKIEIVLGDARLTMEREKPRKFDVLAVDAFSGDSIPTHLLTDEAMFVYIRHLQSDGILAIHISNRYLDLEPVCKSLARKYGFIARAVEAEGDTHIDAFTSTWVLLTKDVSLTERLDDVEQTARPLNVKPGILWTDAYSSVYEVLLNPEADKAIDVITETHWYQKASTTRSEIELKHLSMWWRDGWTYFRTWPACDDSTMDYDLRVQDSRLEVRPTGQTSEAWKSAE